MTTLRDRLRNTPSVVGRPPHFDPSTAPDEPRELFVDWLNAALAADVAEPHALTLSTVDPQGRPDARGPNTARAFWWTDGSGGCHRISV